MKLSFTHECPCQRTLRMQSLAKCLEGRSTVGYSIDRNRLRKSFQLKIV